MTEVYFSGFLLYPLLEMAYTVINMEIPKHPTSSNDYAVAKALNNEVMAIIILVVIADVINLPEDYEIQELNRAYILLTNELEQVYDRNPALAAIKPEPIWKRFDVLKTSTWEINEYLEDARNDMGQAHVARIEKLCIISITETPDFSIHQKELINNAKRVTSKHGKMLDKVHAEVRASKEKARYIAEYTLTYELDGTILINDVLKLKKTNAGSTTERLLDQAMKYPNTLFKPDLGQTSRNLSTVLSSAGFTPTLRRLFFPIVSKSKGILFRPTVTRQQADDEKLDTSDLDLKLKELDTASEPKTLK